LARNQTIHISFVACRRAFGNGVFNFCPFSVFEVPRVPNRHCVWPEAAEALVINFFLLMGMLFGPP
jgi:hypothetical protein